MTSYNFTLANRPRKNGEYSIVIQFVKDRKNTSLSISKSCKTEDWSFETSRVKKRNKNHKMLNKFIEKYEQIIATLIDDFELSGEPYGLDDLIIAIKNYQGKKLRLSYTEFAEKRIRTLKKAGKVSSSLIEYDTLRSLQKFFKRNKISFKEVDYRNLQKYVTFLRTNGNKNSTIGIRLRTTRAIFNEAIREEIIPKSFYPFDKLKVSKYKSSDKKEFLTMEEIEKLKKYECKTTKDQLAKDMFLFSYYARGINFVDLILLTKSAFSGNHINYLRHKTKAHVTFKVNDFILEVIKRYKAPANSPFIFEFIRRNDPAPGYVKNKTHNYLGKYINPGLKTIIGECGIQKHITFYCARHSFATALKFNNISVETIREALGHRDIKSTMSYLNTLPEKKLDNVIEKIIV